MSPEVSALLAVLDEAGDRVIEMWWRDDDAVAATSALDRLLGLARDADWPIGIAAIPADAGPSLRDRLAAETVPHRVLVHGLCHHDHAAGRGKKAEIGPERPLSELEADVAEGLDRVRAAFGTRALPVLVPPWNRIAPALVPALPSLGYRGLSAFGAAAGVGVTQARSSQHSPAGAGERQGACRFTRADTHIDPVDWRGSRGLLPPAALAAQLRGALEGPGPVGLLTHHLMFDEALWAFVSDLVAGLARHPAVRPVGPTQVFGGESGREASNPARPPDVGSSARMRPAFV